MRVHLELADDVAVFTAITRRAVIHLASLHNVNVTNVSNGRRSQNL